jgi:SAM-dependent methyltransferase
MHDPLAAERALLHAHGAPGAWGSLGLWRAPATQDYASACAALAEAVLAAAWPGPASALMPAQGSALAAAPAPAPRKRRAQPALQPQRVLLLGCGTGQELASVQARWPRAFVLGLEADAARAAQARALGLGDVQHGDALAPPAGPWDVVLSIDAAYHFSPRAAWLRAVRAQMAPGARLAFTDLVLDGRGPGATMLRRLAPMAGVGGQDLLGERAALQRLHDAGFEGAQVQRLEAQVLQGFAAFVPAQAQRLGDAAEAWGWRRVQATAAAMPWCIKMGLGYALFSASAAPAAMRSATSKAEATAASSKGMPTRA